MAKVGRKPGTPRTGGRQKGSPNKRTKLASQILQEIRYTNEEGNSKRGYNSLEVQVKIVNLALTSFLNAPLNEGHRYLAIASSANGKIIDKEQGNIEIVKNEQFIDVEELIKLMPQFEFIKNYKPIEDKDNIETDDI